MKIYFLVIFNFKMDEDHDLLFPTNHIFAFCQAEIRETAWDAALPRGGLHAGLRPPAGQIHR